MDTISCSNVCGRLQPIPGGWTLDFSVGRPTPTLSDFNAIVTIILAGGRQSGNNYTVRKNFVDIKNAFRTLMTKTYTAKIAAATGATVFGALPGTYTDQEKDARLPLMVVPNRVPPYDDDLRADLTFYKTYLSVTLDPEGHGYGRF
jgi:hypothetical protein